MGTLEKYGESMKLPHWNFELFQCSIQWKSNHLVKTKFWLAVRFLFRALYGHLFEASAENHMQSKTQQAESGHTTKLC